jgi:hypothetical protein
MNLTIFKEIWDLSTEDEYFEMLGSLPPAYHFGDGEGMNAFLLGEPSDHDASGLPMYRAFLFRRDLYYRSRRPMTVERFLFEMEELKR